MLTYFNYYFIIKIVNLFQFSFFLYPEIFMDIFVAAESGCYVNVIYLAYYIDKISVGINFNTGSTADDTVAKNFTTWIGTKVL